MTSEERNEKKRIEKRLEKTMKLYRIAVLSSDGYKAIVLLRRLNQISFTLRGYD